MIERSRQTELRTNEHRQRVLGICIATLLSDPMGASEADVRAAAQAAVAGGFAELSVWAPHLGALEGPSELGAHITVIEGATEWATGDSKEAAAEASRIAGLAAAHGAATILAVTLRPALPDRTRARDNLGLLAAAGAEAGAQVCLEFVPWTAIPSLAAAWDLVEPLGAETGIVVDTWHWQRQPGGPDPGLLATIPAERIGYVQVCDAAATPADDLFAEAMSARLLPGDGVVDFAEVLGVLDRIGSTPVVATEVFSSTILADRGDAGAAKAMLEASRAVMPYSS